MFPLLAPTCTLFIFFTRSSCNTFSLLTLLSKGRRKVKTKHRKKKPSFLPLIIIISSFIPHILKIPPFYPFWLLLCFSSSSRRMRPLRRSCTTTLLLAVFLLSMTHLETALADGAAPELYSDEQQPLNPGDFTSPSAATATTTPSTVPAFPVAQASNQSATCRLDISDELFEGVGDACVRGGLDRSRCCPVLAAWLFAAHARSALELLPQAAAGAAGGMLPDDDADPMMPDDNQRCVDSLQIALERRGIRLPRPNATCDTVLCFCGIRLHQIGSLQCPAAFNVSAVAVGGGGTGAARNATPKAAVLQLEHDCRNASYAGCTRCLHSLEKLKFHNGIGTGGAVGDRAARMFGRDCQLMGLTWLLAKNKTAYIPTVSAVLRAILYSGRSAARDGSNYKCSPDQENMPLAVDSLQFQHLEDSSSSGRPTSLFTPILSTIILLLFLPFCSFHVLSYGDMVGKK